MLKQKMLKQKMLKQNIVEHERLSGGEKNLRLRREYNARVLEGGMFGLRTAKRQRRDEEDDDYVSSQAVSFQDPSVERDWIHKYTLDQLNDRVLNNINVDKFDWNKFLMMSSEVREHFTKNRNIKEFDDELHEKLMFVSQIILRRGADPNGNHESSFDDHHHRTPLALAAYYCQKPDLVKLLLRYKAEVNKLHTIKTPYSYFVHVFPLSCAVYGDSSRPYGPKLETVRALLDAGADVNCRDMEKQRHLCKIEKSKGDYSQRNFRWKELYTKFLGTPLHYALRLLNMDDRSNGAIDFSENLEIMKLLLERGANPTIKDDQGRLALPDHHRWNQEAREIFQPHIQKIIYSLFEN